MLGAPTLRAGLLAPSGVTSFRHQLRGSKVNAFPIGGNDRNRSHHLAHRFNNKGTQIKAIAAADKSASSAAGGSNNVVIDNSGDNETIVILSGQNRPGKIYPINLHSRHTEYLFVLILLNPYISYYFYRFIGFSGLYLQRPWP